MRMLWVVLFLVGDLYALSFFQLGGPPPGEAVQTEVDGASWRPSELLEEGNYFRYTISELGKGGQKTMGAELDVTGSSGSGFQVTVTPGGAIAVRKSDLFATGIDDVSTLWNTRIRHPAIGGFRDNLLWVGANWSYTAEDGYLASVVVSSRGQMLGYEGFICDVRERNKAYRLHIAPEIPLLVRYETGLGDTSGFASVLEEWH